MKRGKKSQVTLFIIIGLLFIVGIVLVVLIIEPKNQEISLDVKNIKDFISNCIENTGYEAINEITLNGGYYIAPEPRTEAGIPIYFDNGINNQQKKSDIENEISNYVEKKLFFCTKNFKDFPQYDIKQGKINVITKINDDDVVLDVYYPISITLDKETIYFEKFESVIPLRVGVLYKAILEYMAVQDNYEGVCIECLLDIALKYDIYVDMSDFGEDVIIFIFRDDYSKIGIEPLRFIFANKYEVVRNEEVI